MRTGGDDWDAAIARFIIDKHLQPAVRTNQGVRALQLLVCPRGSTFDKNIEMGLLHDVTLKVCILGVQGIGIRSPQMRARLRAVAESAKVQPECRPLTCDQFHGMLRRGSHAALVPFAGKFVQHNLSQSRDGS